MGNEMEKILSASKTDFLTGCLSKEIIDSTLDKVKAECDIDKKPFTLVVLDLDHFKTYNDKYGHLDGDDILKYFASTLRISLKDTENFIFRFGGDEFIIVFPRKTGKEALAIARNLLKILKKRPFLSRGRIYNLSFSSGIASYPADGHETEEIIEKADKAMYFSKTHGRGRGTLYRQILWNSIKRALIIAAIILLIVGTWFCFQQSSYKDYAMHWLKEKTSKIGATLISQSSVSRPSAAPSPQIYDESIDSIYLKSGRIIQGVIVRDDKDEIELSLNLETGKGSVTIKKSDIENIKKHPQKLPKN